MRTKRLATAAIALALASMGGAPLADARTLVDPTSLTPPLKPFRVCYELGPNVQCDTSGDVMNVNQEIDELPCGVLYTTNHEVSNSTRWYLDGLLVRRAVQEQITGTYTLSPTGAGPTVAFGIEDSWDEHFAVPGDIDSAIRDVSGVSLRIPAVPELKDAGLYLGADDLTHGLSTGDDPVGIAKLCDLLLG
jgi:hypothetical protein